jgi:anti-sigma factor RsiW
MNINRHNYEEYFILYMDNELSSEDRRLVEAFVQSNPDLKDELEMLLQYKLEPDTTITFSGKEKLLMMPQIKEQGAITTANYEEWLVLYIDNELNTAQKIQVENFIALNPLVKKELDTLAQTKLQPDETVVFANKEVLYRKEEKVRALPLLWRWAAAAVLLVAAGLATLLIINNRNTPASQQVTVSDNKQQSLPVKSTSINPVNNPVASVKEEKETLAAPAINSSTGSTVKEQSSSPARYVTNRAVPDKKIQVPHTTIVPENTPLKKNEPVVAEQNKPSNNLPAPLQNPYFNTDAKEAYAKTDMSAGIKNIPDPLTNPVVTKHSALPSGIRTAVNTEPVSDEDTDQANSGKKNKLRGFLRKVTRTFEKRTNIDATNGDDRLLIAGLSFKLK